MSEKLEQPLQSFIGVSTPEIIDFTISGKQERICKISVSASDWQVAMRLAAACPHARGVLADKAYMDGVTGSFSILLDLDTSDESAAMQAAWMVYQELMTLLPDAPQPAQPHPQSEAIVKLFKVSVARWPFDLKINDVAILLDNYRSSLLETLKSLRTQITVATQQKKYSLRDELVSERQGVLAEMDSLNMQGQEMYNWLKLIYDHAVEVERQSGFLAAAESVYLNFAGLETRLNFLSEVVEREWARNLADTLAEFINNEVEA